MRVQVIFCVLVCLVAPARAGEIEGRLRIQMGHEYDSNARRIYSPREADSLLRSILEGLVQYKSGPHQLMLDYQGGFKLFHNQKSENLLVNRLRGSYGLAAGESVGLGARASLLDTILDEHDRDFRALSAELFLQGALLPWLELEFYVGGRHFNFKPDEYMAYSLKLSHAGPCAGLRLYLTGAPDIGATFFYQVEARLFDDHARKLSGGTFITTGVDRLDVRHVGGVHIRHPIRYWATRRLILAFSYILSVNDSTSAGSSAMWHRLRIRCSLQLPLDIGLHLMGTLQFTNYPDGFYVETDLYDPDADENENSLVLQLTVPLWRDLSLVVQGAAYRNEFDSSALNLPAFKRETVMVGLAYNFPF
jgi:hypothetical protein